MCRKLVARVEAGPQGTDTRFVVTNLAAGSARRIYEAPYCRRGQAENHIKAWKRHLAADRTSCMKAHPINRIGELAPWNLRPDTA